MEREWIIVASRDEVRIFKYAGPNKLELLRDIGNPLGLARAHELVTDKPGRSTDNRMRARHSYSTEQTKRERVLIDFYRDIVEILDKAWLNHEYEALTIIAEPRLLGIIRELLPTNLKRVLKREIAKDLSYAEETNIIGRLRG
jgi:protein required for attachment to host cells